MAELTPMMRQYMEEKEKHPDSLLFFRLGDFYEMFGPDARTASRELDLALTTRDKDKSKSDEERIPMCGVPYHSAEGYIARLIAKGYKVSICEQMEDPALAKGLVKREIIRTVTPGTVLDEACLDAGRSNYLCGVYLSETAAGLCAADISTGQAQVTAFTGAQRLTGLINELGRFAPAEAVMNAAAYDDPALTAALEERFSCRRERLAEGRFDVSDAEKKVRLQFGEAALRDLPRNESAPLLALGGLLTNGYVTNCEAGVAISGDKILIKGVFDKLVTRMVEKGGAIRGYDLIRSNKYYPFDTSRCENDLQITPWDPEAFKLSADELMAEHGVKVYFYTQFTEILKEGNKVVGGVIENRSGRQVILAKRVVDCTGAAAVAQMAGAECCGVGRKGSMTLMFRVGNVKNVVPSYKPNVKEIPYGAVNFFPLIREGDFRVEMTRYIGSENSAEDYTKGTIECRRQCQEVLQYLKEHWIGFEDAYIIDTAPTLGSLAQPALVGEKKMTQEMILKREMPDDRIAITAYGIDLHSPEMGGQNFLYYLTPGEYYGVPFGVVVPKSPVENLLVGGKCVSTERDAFSSVCCSAISMATGEAAGTACAISIREGVNARDVDIGMLQQALVKNGVLLDPEPAPSVEKYYVYPKREFKLDENGKLKG